MQDFARALRTAGIVIFLMGVAWLLWVALLGPEVLILLRPR